MYERPTKVCLVWGAAEGDSELTAFDNALLKAGIGHLNLIHPLLAQVLGRREVDYLEGLEPGLREQTVARIFEGETVCAILCDAIEPPGALLEAAGRAGRALLTSTEPSQHVINVLRPYMQLELGEVTTLHGVMLDVLEIGVLITGESAIGKSELALELISRGHGLVADDVVEISRIAATTLEGRCPPLLKDFLEVRGLGLVNIRAIYGETAVRPKMKVKLIAHLERPVRGGVRDAAERLPLSELAEDILGVTVRKVVIPVAAGRNLAVLIEAAVRNYILQLRGKDSAAEFLARQERAMKDGNS